LSCAAHNRRNQRILITLHKPKYDSVVCGLHGKGFDKLEVYELVNKIQGHEMSVHGETKEAPMQGSYLCG